MIVFAAQYRPKVKCSCERWKRGQSERWSRHSRGRKVLKRVIRDFPGSPVIKESTLQCWGAQVPSLIRE